MHSPLILYYHHHCHLCEQMLAELHALYAGKLQLSLVDVDVDIALQARYGLQVSVLVGGTNILSWGRLDRSRLEDYLKAL